MKRLKRLKILRAVIVVAMAAVIFILLGLGSNETFDGLQMLECILVCAAVYWWLLDNLFNITRAIEEQRKSIARSKVQHNVYGFISEREINQKYGLSE